MRRKRRAAGVSDAALDPQAETLARLNPTQRRDSINRTAGLAMPSPDNPAIATMDLMPPINTSLQQLRDAAHRHRGRFAALLCSRVVKRHAAGVSDATKDQKTGGTENKRLFQFTCFYPPESGDSINYAAALPVPVRDPAIPRSNLCAIAQQLHNAIHRHRGRFAALSALCSRLGKLGKTCGRYIRQSRRRVTMRPGGRWCLLTRQHGTGGIF